MRNELSVHLAISPAATFTLYSSCYICSKVDFFSISSYYSCCFISSAILLLSSYASSAPYLSTSSFSMATNRPCNFLSFCLSASLPYNEVKFTSNSISSLDWQSSQKKFGFFFSLINPSCTRLALTYLTLFKSRFCLPAQSCSSRQVATLFSIR